MNWDALGALTNFLSALGQVAIAGVAAYIAYRQWIESKEDALEQKELTERIERDKQAAMEEQERIIRGQSLDAYFEGISHLLLSNGTPNATAQKFAKGRTDALLKILKPDEKRNLMAFLYGSELLSFDGDQSAFRIGLSGSDLSAANLQGASLRKAGLSMANLRGADLRGADLSEADLRGADLQGANLRGADLSPANLHGAILSAADLSGADLSGADLRETNFSKAYLSEADLSGANLDGANFSGAYMTDVNLSGAYLSDTNLSAANLDGAQLVNLVSINGADFTDAEDLSEEARGYLCSIATGTHPVTKRDTRATLVSIQESV